MISSGKSVNRISISRHASLRMLLFFTFALVAACLSVIVLAVNGTPIFIILLPVIVWSYVSALRQQALLLSNKAVTSLRRDSMNCWFISYQGKEVEARLLNSSFVTAGLIVLRFSTRRRWWSESIVLFPDSMSSSEFHGLLMNLRTQAAIEDQAI